MKRLAWDRGLALGLTLGTALAGPLAGSALRAQDPVSEVVTSTAGEELTLTLPECVAMALDRQPALAAHRAGLASAQDNCRGLERLHVPAFISRELPIRRKQARLGVTVAAAGLDQAEHETVYAVVRTYYSVIFARAQKQVADSTVDRLRATLEAAQGFVQAGSRDVTTGSVDKITVYMRLAQTRQAEAQRGIERATAALREAIGLDPCTRLVVPNDQLPAPRVSVSRDDIVCTALARRGELVQAGTAACVTRLEVDAQATTCRPTLRTFASVVDIHSRTVPEGIADGEYRPGAVAPDMPTSLAGPKSYRMDRARDLTARASAVAEKTRNLIALEAEDAFLRWQETSRRVPLTREAAQKASGLAENTQKDFAGGVKVSVQDVLSDEVLEAQARAQHNEALYHHVLALAAMERVTAGGFTAGLVNPPVADSTSPRAPGAGD